MITLYGGALSGNVHKVRMALALLGLPYEEIAVDATGRKTPEFLARNPMGQIPLLVDGDFMLRDSHAILAYLAAKHSPGEWDGYDPQERGQIGVWLAHSANEILNGPGFLRLGKLFGAAIDAERTGAVTARILPVVEAHLATRDWLVGRRMTIADLAASPYLALAGDGGIDLADWPQIKAWVQRIGALPAFPEMPGWLKTAI
jgi:glutathione S-transferase